MTGSTKQIRTKNKSLELTDEEIKDIKKEHFRKMIKHKIEINAAKEQEEKRRGHSKSKNIKFGGFSPAKYLLSKNLSTEEVQTLFKLRTRMIDVKDNFKSTNRNNMWCKTCQLFIETQQHLIDCPEIRIKTKHLMKHKELNYNMISGPIEQQEKFAKKYHLILKARKEILMET